ncbi:hypothetical protein BGZ65_003878 [Modicella reniformis]|uniref:Chitin-binding type-4 domain-containing protein n=1 Tax=Modicella reniformis TaxID=1440133 RepID=A0A9P6INM6_9FUNG|nr:hypothetical protein BGZ65_003878 [Modicella reniformis]
MIFKATSAAILVSALAVFSSYTPQVEAHSWVDCVDWRFNKPGPNQDWSDKGGKCMGYARRFPLNKAFGSLDSANPSRHYQQAGNPNKALPCSDHKHGKDIGSNETRADPPEDAYGGIWGHMTVTNVGDQLCVRWPAKNHAESNEDDTEVQINFSTNRDGKDPTQEQLLANKPILLPYKNCNRGPIPDRRACGGCFDVPKRAPGLYLMQWRWMLNPGEWYTSCADIQIGAGNVGKNLVAVKGKGKSTNHKGKH